MIECFTPKNFNRKSRDLLVDIDRIVRNYAAQGYDLSLRQLYYQLVAANIIPNSERSYKNIGSLVSDARLAGLIDWQYIRDRGRVPMINSHWEKPADIIKQAASAFRIDRWENQQFYVEVMVEKQALEGVLIPVCRSLDVTFTANKGYTSSSAMYDASKRLLEQAYNGKYCHVIYLGDHDPSGIDMTRDVEERFKLFMGEMEDYVHVHRAALNMDQIEELNPPENPAKLTDSRADGYIRRFGESSWELDAIEPKALADLVTEQIEQWIDWDDWEVREKRETEMRDELNELAKKSKFKDRD